MCEPDAGEPAPAEPGESATPSLEAGLAELARVQAEVAAHNDEAATLWARLGDLHQQRRASLDAADADPAFAIQDEIERLDDALEANRAVAERLAAALAQAQPTLLGYRGSKTFLHIICRSRHSEIFIVAKLEF